MTAATLWLPRDAAAVAAGADDVAAALDAAASARNLPLALVRNGSRGLLWLEPLLEVATPAGRVAFGPVQVGDVVGAGGQRRGVARDPDPGRRHDAVLPKAAAQPSTVAADTRARRRSSTSAAGPVAHRPRQ